MNSTPVPSRSRRGQTTLHEPLLTADATGYTDKVERRSASLCVDVASEEEAAGLYSTITFGWLNKTIARGYAARLEPSDALKVPTAFHHRTCFETFSRSWQQGDENWSSAFCGRAYGQ